MAVLPGKLKTETWPWMTAAVLLVGGFMFWLYTASSRVEDDTAAAAADTATGGVPLVPDSVFATDPGRFARRRILVRPVRVEETLGRAALTLNLPQRPGYPAILDRPVLEQDFQVVSGDDLAIAGWVFALNDSILNVWEQRGLYESGNREKLQGSETFFLVDSLDFVIPGEQGSTGGNGQ